MTIKEQKWQGKEGDKNMDEVSQELFFKTNKLQYSYTCLDLLSQIDSNTAGGSHSSNT